MATKAPKAKKDKSEEPIVTVGSHSVRTQYANGKVHFVVDDDKLRADVLEALAEFAGQKNTATTRKKVEKVVKEVVDRKTFYVDAGNLSADKAIKLVKKVEKKMVAKKTKKAK
jgi:hypothetical protein